MWSSVHAKGYTLVIVVTIFLAVWNDGHHTKSKIVDETRTAQLVQCQAGSPCPAVSEVINTVTTSTVPYPEGGDGGNGNGDGNDHGNGNGQGGDNGRGLKVGQERN